MHDISTGFGQVAGMTWVQQYWPARPGFALNINLSDKQAGLTPKVPLKYSPSSMPLGIGDSGDGVPGDGGPKPGSTHMCAK